MLENNNPLKHGSLKVFNSSVFRIPATDFIISPLAADANLYIKEIYNGVEQVGLIELVPAGDYTKVTGAGAACQW